MNTLLNIRDQVILKTLFPGSIVTIGANPLLMQERLLPEEQLCIHDAVLKRRLEFIAGRVCARKLLSKYGWPDYPIVIGKDRVPVWPPDIVGSISHTEGFCGVAVALKSDFSSIGLDVECIGKMKQDIWRCIATPSELNWIQSLPGCEQQKYATLIFSAKECFYKCQYMITKRWFNFHDVVICLSSDQGEFAVRSSDKIYLWDRIEFLQGKYLFHDQYVFIGMCIPTSAN